MARYLLRNASDITFEDFQALAYDTTLYWPMTELPSYARRLRTLEGADPDLAARVRPYLEHLLDWDFRSSLTSTQATLAVGWYEELYGRGYPVETLKPEYVNDMPARFLALERAAEKLTELYGDWRVPYGDVHRIQRHANQPSAGAVPFSDDEPSLPLAGVPRPARRRVHAVPLAAHDTRRRRGPQAALRRDRRLLHGRLRVRRENRGRELPPLRPEPPTRFAPTSSTRLACCRKDGSSRRGSTGTTSRPTRRGPTGRATHGRCPPVIRVTSPQGWR